jgi:hypothetical protein
MRLLTKEILKNEAKPHQLGSGYQFTEKIGDYTLSIVGGVLGLYGDFETDFEVALIDDTTDDFVTGFFCKRGESTGVLAYATIDEINDLYLNIPRKK